VCLADKARSANRWWEMRAWDISEPSLQKNRLAQRPFAACYPELLDRGCLLVVREVVYQRGNFRLEVLPSDLQQAFIEQEASAAELVKAVSRRMAPLLRSEPTELGDGAVLAKASKITPRVETDNITPPERRKTRRVTCETETALRTGFKSANH